MEGDILTAEYILNAVLNQLGDSYEYRKSLGEGASSKVYLLYQRHLKQNRALKIMDYQYIRQSMVKGSVSDSKEEFNKRKKRFINEAKIYKKIKHPNIAEIYDIRQVKDKNEHIEIPYIIMQYVEGETLSDLLKKNKKPLKLERAAPILGNILDALDAIHQQGIIHRDIKPSNIMIEKSTGNAILIDFGHAKDMDKDATQLTKTGSIMGSPLYMAPEQFRDSSKAGPKTDVYSFGVILYEMLTGAPPYTGTGAEIMYSHLFEKFPDIKKEDPGLPGVVDTLIRKSTAKEVVDREGDIKFYKEKLENFIKKPEPPGVELVKIKASTPKPNVKRISVYAASFLFILTIAYIIYINFSPRPKEISQRLEKENKISEPASVVSPGQGSEKTKLPGLELEEKDKSGKEKSKEDKKEQKGGGNQGKTDKVPEVKKAEDVSDKRTQEYVSSNVDSMEVSDHNTGEPGVEKIEFSQNALYQPDPVYYLVKRKELLRCSVTDMKTFPIRWVVASASEGLDIYRDSSLEYKRFQAKFLQLFEVLNKEREKLLVRELNTSSKRPRTGWVGMKNLIYLPRALKDERTSVYQKAVFTHIEEHLDMEKNGDITFYKSCNGSREYETRPMGTLRIAYVYAWENTDFEDSKYVLIGKYPAIKGILTDKRAFKRNIYGWCKTTILYPWNSRIALIPNKEENARVYIFRSGPGLTKFYSKADPTSVPDLNDLLTVDSHKMWRDSNWPFFLEGRLKSENQDYLRLVCLVKAEKANKQEIYLLKFCYAKDIDPYTGKRLFEYVSIFNKSEIVKIVSNLGMTLKLLLPRKVNALWKDLIESIYGEEYDSKRTFNEYAQMNDGIWYRDLSVLFGKTQEQLFRLNFSDFEEIELKIIAVKQRLEDLINGKENIRFFGPEDDPFIWLYEDEMP